MTHHDQISQFIDNELGHEAEQDFLISLASNESVRKAFRSELVLKNVIHQDELLTTPNREMRGALLAALGIGAASTAVTETASAAQTGLKAFFATKLNTVLTIGMISLGGIGGYVAGTTINAADAEHVGTSVVRTVEAPRSITTPAVVAEPAATVTENAASGNDATRTQQPVKKAQEQAQPSDTKPTGTVMGVGASSAEPEIK